MKFTDIFVRRPVMASVVSLLILLAGVRSFVSLQVRQYPKLENTVVTVTTAYPGASSKLVKGFITQPLQQAMAQANGIDYLSSTSTQGLSTIKAHMRLNYDPNAAVAEIQAKVASQRSVLPANAQDPVIDSTTGSSTSLMYMAFYSKHMKLAQITDYLLRVVQPMLQAVPGVAKAHLIGNRSFAMRIWLNPARMAALGVTAADVVKVLRANNYLAGIGQTKGSYVTIDLSASTDVANAKDFRNLVVRSSKGTLVRIRDIAKAKLGSEKYNSTNWYKGKPAIFIGIDPAPGANPLDVAHRIHALMPNLRSQLPEGLSVVLPYDASVYIQDSINEVFRTIAEAILIVLVVIYLSLGTFRAAAIPAIAVPLSLIGCGLIMLAFGFSINLLTLLAMVLAIGLVVDDAIVVVENIHRHIEEGQTRVQAAILGARELMAPIISMTTTLLAVFAPIGFMGGLTGSLFSEFAFTLAGAVIVSGIAALTLSPMMSSHFLKAGGVQGRFERAVERFFVSLSDGYQNLLHRTLNYRPVTYMFAAVVFIMIFPMFLTSRSELAPTEDQSILFFKADGPQTATVDYDVPYTRQILKIFKTFPEYKQSFFLLGMGSPSTVFGGFKMPPPSERNRSQMQLQPLLQRKLHQVAGFHIGVFNRPSIPGAGGGFPVQFVLTSPHSYRQLAGFANKLVGHAMRSGRFIFLRKSVSIDRPSTKVMINRDLAGDLGVSMQNIGQDLGAMLGGGYVNRFDMQGRSYKVIPQVARKFRLSHQMLDDYYVRSASSKLVPLSTLVSFKQSVEPSSRPQFQQLNSITLEGVNMPGTSLGGALGYLKAQAKKILPKGYSYNYAGESRQYIQQGNTMIVTFLLSIVVIYLVLAAQFESWRDPLIILVAAPMSIAGALIFITLGFSTMNIYTEVGLLTLVGLIAKNGILIVQFANQLQVKEGLGKREAVERAARIRLRPILMTTVAMIVATVPLLTATGPGAVSRADMGKVISEGLGIGTLFTLFVVPAVYMLLARDHNAQREAPSELTAGGGGSADPD